MHLSTLSHKRLSEKKSITMVKPFAISHGMFFVIETKPSPHHIRDGLVEGSVEGFY
jgi:hypothetical protein